MMFFSTSLYRSLACLIISFLLASCIPNDVFGQNEPEKLYSLSEEIQLFDGKSLAGWHFYTRDDQVSAEDVWTVQDGILKCTGRPAGYLQTKRWYRDYELELHWRWSGERGGNSGVLVHTTTPLVFYGWPKSMEVQLQSKSAGDFWVICDGVDIRVENEADRRPEPKKGDQHSHRRIRRLPGDFEKPVGQWNRMRVICRGDEVEVYINDRLANHGTQCTVTEGAIALQSEGTAVEFKEIHLKPLSK